MICWQQDADDQGSEQRLLEAMPSILDFIDAAEAGCSTAAPDLVRASGRSGANLVRRRTSSSSSDGEAGADSFAHLPGHVPSSADGCACHSFKDNFYDCAHQACCVNLERLCSPES